MGQIPPPTLSLSLSLYTIPFLFISLYIHICMHIHVKAFSSICVCVYMYTCIHADMYIHTCICISYTHMHTYISAYVYTCIYVYVYVCRYVSVYVFIGTRVSISGAGSYYPRPRGDSGVQDPDDERSLLVGGLLLAGDLGRGGMLPVQHSMSICIYTFTKVYIYICIYIYIKTYPYIQSSCIMYIIRYIYRGKEYYHKQKGVRIRNPKSLCQNKGFTVPRPSNHPLSD